MWGLTTSGPPRSQNSSLPGWHSLALAPASTAKPPDREFARARLRLRPRPRRWKPALSLPTPHFTARHAAFAAVALAAAVSFADCCW